MELQRQISNLYITYPRTFGVQVAVIPAYNEAATIGSVVMQTRPHVDSVIVVDDGSDDQTAQIADRAGVQVLAHNQNRGKGKAIQTGLEAGIEIGANILILLDGDGQHDPDSIPELIEPIKNESADLVIGSREQPGQGTPSRHRKLGRGVLDSITNVVSDTTVSDTQSGFRAIHAELAEEFDVAEDGMGSESSMLSQANTNGARIVEVPIEEHYPETATPTHHPIKHAIAVLNSLLRIIRRDHPLFVFGIIGLVSLLFGGYLGYDMTTHYWATGEFWPGRAMVSMLFTIIGTQLMTAALILDSVKLRSNN